MNNRKKRSFFRSYVSAILKVPLRTTFGWKIIDRLLLRSADRVRAARRRIVAERLAERLSVNPTVLCGPFIGMRYPELKSVGSTLFPKLLGTYEAELFSVMETIRALAPSIIVDIGCAEGYYAVGLALIFPGARVIAYDVSAEARILCEKMARVNGVEEQVMIREFCDASELRSLGLKHGSLVIADCEGYEKMLFTRETARHLSASHLLIELHDFYDPEISPQLDAALAPTHNLEFIHSIDDLQKARTYQSRLVSETDPIERELAFAEQRPVIMRWIFATPKGIGL